MSVSIVTYGEIYEGVLFSRRPAESEASFLNFLRYADVLPLDEALMRRFAGLRGSLRKKGEKMADPDLIIAATALHHDLTLVTRNLKHFTRIPALKLHPIPE
ncbi:MAG: type II toxin-antitoxin system VapC family toxin [Thermomicrobiales bacterium]